MHCLAMGGDITLAISGGPPADRGVQDHLVGSSALKRQ